MKELTRRFSAILILITFFTLFAFPIIAKSQSVTAGFTYNAECLYFEFTNTSSSTGGEIISYNWEFGDGGTSSATNPDHTYSLSGIYTVTLVATHETLITDVFSMEVTAVEAVADFFYSQDCALFHFYNSSVPTENIDSVYWHFGEDDTVKLYSAPFNYDHIYSTSGNYQINLLIFVDGCSDKKTTTINFIEPQANFNFLQVIDTFYFHDLSTPTAEIIAWNWDFGDGNSSTVQNPEHFYSLTGTYTVELKVTSLQGCLDSITHELTFYHPVAEFSSTNNCEVFTFTDLSTPNDSIVAWFWDFGDGSGTSTLQNPVYSYTNDGSYEVMLAVYLESGSSDSVTNWVSFYHPDVQFSHDPVCLGNQTCFYDESAPGSGTIIGWDWDFGNGNSSSLQNPCYIYGNQGTYYVTLTVENSIGCISISDIDTLIVDYPPEPNFSSSASCFNEPTFFENLTDSNNIEILSWQWDFGDPASGANNSSSLFEPQHLFTSEGPFQVKLTVENIYGCRSDITKPVVVDSIPEAAFSIPDTIAAGNTLTIIDQSIAHGTPILTKLWNFGDGVTLINPNPVIHTYSDPGIYEICLVVTNLNDCIDSLCQTIVVTGLPHADFTYVLSPNLRVDFDDDSYTESIILNWYWNFGDPTVTSDTISGNPNPYYVYPYEGFYPVYLEITDSYNGKHDTTKTIYVGKAIHSLFVTDDICSGDSVEFFDQSYSNVGAQFLSWYWDFGDNNDLLYFEKRDSLTHYYDSPGVYDVTMVTTAMLNGEIAKDTLIKQVKVFHDPIAEIGTEHLVVCLGQPINFVDSSYSIDGDSITSWYWEFGDYKNGTSDLQFPSYTYDSINEYQVILTVNTVHTCVNKDTVMARVSIAPNVDFTVENSCINSPTYFLHTESDIEITDWIWNFNDPYNPGVDTSTLETPSYVYTHIDIYHVTMMASSYGCEKMVEKSFLVYPIPFSDFNITPDFEGVQGRTQFTNGSIYATSYLWDFGNGHTSSVEDPIEVYEYDSTYIITLISYNEYGCADTSRYDLKVFFRGLYFPTAFSPNNPNYEVSRFMPKGINLKEYHVQVFDLKGNLMWESNLLDEYGSPVESWDGYYNGILMPEGMYVWKARGIFKDGTEWKGSDFQYESPQTNGTVTLIR
jgi:PKD repeat protein